MSRKHGREGSNSDITEGRHPTKDKLRHQRDPHRITGQTGGPGKSSGGGSWPVFWAQAHSNPLWIPCEQPSQETQDNWHQEGVFVEWSPGQDWKAVKQTAIT